METKAQNQMSESKWSFGEVFGLVAVGVLVCGAMVAYWVFEEILPHVWWGLSLPIGIMAGLLGIAFALRSHYGKGTLLGSRFLLLPAALYFVFFSTTHPHRGNGDSITLTFVSYALGLSIGMVMGILMCRDDEKHIVGDRLRRGSDRNVKNYILIPVGLAVGFALFFGLARLCPPLIGMQVFAGLFLGMTFYSLVWTFLYEKRTGIRVIIER
jgi:hypothetical protein